MIDHANTQGRRICRWAGVAMVLGLAAAEASGQCHAVTNLGTLPGASEIHVRDLNSAGQVVGYALTSAYQAFLYSGGTMFNLGALGGVESYAHGINDAGQVVGSAQIITGEMHAFLYAADTMIDLHPVGSSQSAAIAINNAGQVAGYNLTAAGECHAFVWQNGILSDIGAIGLTSCEIWDINALGEIVGVLQTVSAELHAFAWTSTLGIVDLGTLGGVESHPYRISDTGQIVGATLTGQVNTQNSPITQAFLYRGGGVTQLGTLGGESSAALGVNNIGQVVGGAETSTGERHAFLFDANSGMQDLNALISPTSGWGLQSANVINDAGWIAGVGVFGGQQRAFLLTPAQSDANGDGVADACEAAVDTTQSTTSSFLPTCGRGVLPVTLLMVVAFVSLRMGGHTRRRLVIRRRGS